MKIREDFLHYLWRMQQFNLEDLATTTNVPIQIINFGELNTDAGPDFLNAKIKIGETVWVGNVEMHVKASEWLKHKHQNDSAYNNVILHVVYDNDKTIQRKTGEPIDALELRKRIPAKIIGQYIRLMNNEAWIPCQYHFSKIPDITKSLWIDRLMIERLEGRVQILKKELEANDNNWEVTFYHRLARNFGSKINTEPFEVLAKTTPLLTLAKHKNNLFQLEALIFGQAGFLHESFEEEYPNALKKEYDFLQKKYSLFPLMATIWRFMRLRPANFPTIRLAQFAALIHQSTHLFSKVLEAETIEAVKQLFEDIEVSEYWLTHYKFDKISKKRTKNLGKSTIELFIINTIIPFLFHYGREKGLEDYEKRAFHFLEQLPAESNRIISKWKDLKYKPNNAYQTQALLELKRNYCDQKRCLDCAIGNKILRNL
ncbi:MAG: DUF2851 family protein [Saprospiraceae bacterium]